MTYQFEVTDAKKYGLHEAILLYNFNYWLLKNKANGINQQDGRTWTYNSIRALDELFPFLSSSQIRRAIRSLVDQGVLIEGCFNQNAYDRTKWYSLSDESILQNEEIHLSDSANGFDADDKPIPDNKPNSKPDVKPNKTEKFSEDDLVTAKRLQLHVDKDKPKPTSEANVKKWADSIRLCREQDGYNTKQINAVIDYVFSGNGDWWKDKVRSGKKLRDYMESLTLQANRKQKDAIDLRSIGTRQEDFQGGVEFYGGEF